MNESTIQLYAKHFFWWSRNNTVKNAGDYFTPFLIAEILKIFPQHLDRLVSHLGARKVLSIGSVLHFAKDDDIVWGSGVNGKISMQELRFRRLAVHAVRGPKTRRVLLDMGIECPEVYGDPAILAPAFFPETLLRKLFPRKSGVCLVPHLNENSDIYKGCNLEIVSPKQDPIQFIAELTAYDGVVSSALHGYIFAEAYGIPCALLKNHSGESPFKYADYQLGTGRKETGPQELVSDALRNLVIPDFDLKVLQHNLIASFPFQELGLTG